MGKFIVLLGAPGAGKGTQAKRLSRELNVPHISSGDIFRENLKDETELGNKAKEYLDRGQLVPDDLTVSMIRERLERDDCSDGAILDGFPRTTPQAEALDGILADQDASLDAVIYIYLPEQVAIERLSGRWLCRAEGHLYHETFNPPKKPGVCDIDGSELYQREDDKPETVAKRIRVYRKQTAPLVAYYRDRDTLVEVDGDQPIEQLTSTILDVLSNGASA
jgi:adenylate kinase